MTSQTLIDRLEELGPWYHSVVVGDYTTPGSVDPLRRARLALAELPEDLTGRTVLDLGGNCGGVAFEFAKRGAAATVLEAGARYVQQGRTLAEALDLEVRFERGVVYDAPGLGAFDYVLFYGLIYHLRHPFLALDQMRAITKQRLFLSSRLSPGQEKVWAIGNVEASAVHEHAYNWWMPSASGMEETLRVYGFADVKTLEIDTSRSEGFWSASPDPAVPLITR